MSDAATPIPHVRLIFLLIVAAFFMDVIDASIVQIALPTIEKDFVAPLADYQWVYGAYAITLAGFLMLMGRAGDTYGQKKIFLAGLVVFTAGSLGGGLAPSLLSLITARAAQGIGAAMTTVTAFAIFIQIFPEGPQRNRAFGILTAILSGGFVAGTIIGGSLTYVFGWRSVMFINVPIGVATLLLCRRLLPGGAGKGGQKLDMPGALSVTTGIILLVYGLTNAAIIGLTSDLTVVPLGLAVVVLGVFLAIESRSKAPLMPLEFIKRGSVFTANVVALVLTSIVGGIAFIMTIYFQNILGYSALGASLLILPPGVLWFLVGGWGASRFLNRFGAKRTILFSSAMMAIGTAMLTLIAVNGSYFTLLPGLMVWALGASVGFPAVNIAALAGTKPGEEGLASGVVSTSFRIGFPVGLAVLLSIAGAFDPLPAGPPSAAALAEGIVAGFRVALIAGALLGALAFAIALRLKDVKPQWGPPPGENPSETKAQGDDFGFARARGTEENR
jgi:MFS family permease